MTRYYQSDDLANLGQQLLDRATADDPEARLDLSILLQLRGDHQAGLALQSLALADRQHYRLEPDIKRIQTRLLALLAPGDLMTNMPLEFLCKGAGLCLDMLYVTADQPLPEVLPDHDVLIVAVCEMERNLPVLTMIDTALPRLRRPLLNRPECILRVTRDRLWVALADTPGLCVPATRRVSRTVLEGIAAGSSTLSRELEGGVFPIIVRPVDSHAGQGLGKMDTAQALGAYLGERLEADFFISPFVDYRDDRGQFRKYRIVLIDGQPFLVHMAISEHWMVHYLNAGMTESATKRELEAKAMADFRDGFASRHGDALKAIHRYTELDYFAIDCAQTQDGKLLVFEAGSSMVVHDMDPVETFPYKQSQMQDIFAAFGGLLRARAASS